MQVSKESLEELKALLTKDYGRDFIDAEVEAVPDDDTYDEGTNFNPFVVKQ